MRSNRHYARSESVDTCLCFSFLQWGRQSSYNGYYTNQMASPRRYHSGPYSSPSYRVPQQQRILFYHKHKPYYGFTNFSPHQVKYRGKKYPTSEHLFQAMKFLDHKPLLAEHIRTCSRRPSDAFSEAHRFQSETRNDWQHIRVEKMEEVLRLKFDQHASLKRDLLGTGDAELIEDSDKDSFWGIGADKKGRNELGHALMRLREGLRAHRR